MYASHDFIFPALVFEIVFDFSQLDGDEAGLVYATPDAENFDSVSDANTKLAGSDMCGDSTDANRVTTLLLETIEEDGGLDGVVSGVKLL